MGQAASVHCGPSGSSKVSSAPSQQQQQQGIAYPAPEAVLIHATNSLSSGVEVDDVKGEAGTPSTLGGGVSLSSYLSFAAASASSAHEVERQQEGGVDTISALGVAGRRASSSPTPAQDGKTDGGLPVMPPRLVVIVPRRTERTNVFEVPSSIPVKPRASRRLPSSD